MGWDGCFAARELDLVRAACAQRGHSFTSVYDRRPEDGPCRGGRTIIEAALNSLLDELDDDSRFVEFWYRDQWKPIDPHRDVDEALCRRCCRLRMMSPCSSRVNELAEISSGADSHAKSASARDAWR